MIFNDMRSFLKKLEEDGDLLRLNGVDWNLEMGALTELLAEQGGPALLFDKIKGYPPGYRVTSNLYNTLRRFNVANNMPEGMGKLEVVKKLRGKAFQPVSPVYVKTGPIMENVHTGDQIDLLEFPTPKWHERDGGRYMGTGVVIIMKDPEEGWINAGVQRAMLHDKNNLGLMCSPGKHNFIIQRKYWERGLSCPVVLAIGADPILFRIANEAVPWGISEFDWAGWFRGEPVSVIKGDFTGLPFPANCEIVIEGEIVSRDIESRPEGPFGEWTGYYAGETMPEPVIHVKAVYHRDEPILHGAPPLKPPGGTFSIQTHSICTLWDELEKAGVRNVKGVWQMEPGGGRLLTVISIKQDHAGHAKQAGLIAAGSHGAGYMGRFYIVVDDDIDPTDMNDVLWAVATRADPETSIDIIKDCWGGRLDPAIPCEKKEKEDYSRSIAIINACKKPFYQIASFPQTSRVTPALRSEVIKKWEGMIPALKKSK